MKTPNTPPNTSYPTLVTSDNAREVLRLMLEAADAKDNNLPGPLDEVDPASLDELSQRIDNDINLGQVPHPNDIAKLIKFYWLDRKRALVLQEQMVKEKGEKKVRKPGKLITTPSFLSDEDEDPDEC